MVAPVPGTTMDMVKSQYAAFGPAMAALVATLFTIPMAQVVPEVAAFAAPRK